MSGQELAKAGRQVVADAAERGEFFFLRAGGLAGIPDAPVDALGGTREDGTSFGGGVAGGDERVEALALEFGGGLGTVRGDVDADLAHGFDGQRANVTVGLAAGAVHFVGAAAELAKKALGHLAAHAIAGAEDENAMG